MVTATITAQHGFSAGRVITRAFDVLGRNLRAFYLLALLAQLPVLAMSLLYVQWIRSNLVFFISSPAVAWTIYLAIWVIAAFLSFVFFMIVAYRTISDLAGKRAPLKDCITAAARDLPTCAAMLLLVQLGIYGGLLLLLVPGFFAASAWFVLVPVRAMEGGSIFDSFRRSAELTRGHRWALLGFWTAFVLVPIAFSVLSSSLVRALFQIVDYWQLAELGVISSCISHLVCTPVAGTIYSSTYYELRTIKEGMGTQQLASVFD